MKKQPIVIDILLDIFVVLILLLLSASLFAENQQNQTDDPLSKRVMKLKTDLKLDETQTAKVGEILKKAQSQAVKDREMFKENALNLIDAAWDRREETNLAIEAILNDEQKKEFKRISKMSRFDHELFILTEGLLLDDDQAFTVEGILIKYFNKLEEMIPEGMRDRGEPGMGEGSEGPGSPIGMRRGGWGRGGYYFRSAIKDLQSKNTRAIRKILSKEQRELYRQIIKDRKKKIKERRKEMRKK